MRFLDAIERNWDSRHWYISIGASPPCDECPDVFDEGNFSWSSCDSCGSTIGGSRFAAHAINFRTQQSVHVDICTDCVLFHANGDEPDDWKLHSD